MRMDTSRFPQTSNDWKPARPSASRSSDFRGGRPSHGTILSARHRFRLSQGNAYRVAGCRPRPMVLVERANPADRLDLERLIAAYLTPEGVEPRSVRITWAVEQVMKNRVGGLILVARQKKGVLGAELEAHPTGADT